MAFAIARNKITKNQLDTIVSNLCFNPVVKERKKSYPSRSSDSDEVTSPVLFYYLEKSAIPPASVVPSNGPLIGGTDFLHLPYLFASSLFGIIPNIDNTYRTINAEFTGQLLPRQIPIDQEIWAQLKKYGTSTAAVPPGFGKTVLGARNVCRIGLLACILVHREILAHQWRTTFETFTNLRTWIVGEKNPPENLDVIICMDTRYDSITKEVRDMVGFLIIDEAHAFCTPSRVQCLLAFHPKYILIESATLERDDEMHNMMYAMVGSHGVFRELDVKFDVVKIITGIKPERKLTRFKELNWPHLVSTTLLNEQRNKIITDLVVENPHKTILILTSLVEHVAQLNKIFSDLELDCDYMCGNKKTYKDGHILIGTTSKIGTGFDQETMCADYGGKRFDLLILVCSIKKYAMLVQNVGRVFRANYPTIFHLVDDDMIYESHWRKARKWYERVGGTIYEHRIPVTTSTSTTTATSTTMRIAIETQPDTEWLAAKIRELKMDTA